MYLDVTTILMLFGVLAVAQILQLPGVALLIGMIGALCGAVLLAFLFMPPGYAVLFVTIGIVALVSALRSPTTPDVTPDVTPDARSVRPGFVISLVLVLTLLVAGLAVLS